MASHDSARTAQPSPVVATGLLAALDTACLAAAYMASASIAGTSQPITASMLFSWTFLAGAAAWYAMVFPRRLVPLSHKTAYALAMWSIMFVFAAALLTPDISPWRVVAFVMVQGAFALLLRGVSGLSATVPGTAAHRLVIVGSNERAVRFLGQMESHGSPCRSVMGFVEDNPGRRHLLERCGLRYLGPVRNLERLLCSDVVDEVYVCLPLRTFHSRIRSIVNLCEGIGVPVRMPADFFATQAASTEFIHTKTGLYVSFGTHPEAGLRNVLATARDAMAARFRRHRKWRAVAVWELQSHGVLRPPKPSMLKKLMHGLAVPINLAWNVVRLKRLVKDTGHSHYRELKSDRLSCASHPIEHGVSAMLSLTAEDGPRKHAQRSQGATGCDDSRQ